jgi:hypothetical protein
MTRRGVHGDVAVAGGGGRSGHSGQIDVSPTYLYAVECRASCALYWQYKATGGDCCLCVRGKLRLILSYIYADCAPRGPAPSPRAAVLLSGGPPCAVPCR